MIDPGTPAPDFKLRNQNGERVELSALRGRTVVLVFYPFDFSPVCTDQLTLIQEVIGEFEQREVALYGISVDSAFAHKAFHQQLGLTFPLLADFEPKGRVMGLYGQYISERGHGARGFVVIDSEGVVRHWERTPTPLEMPSAESVIAAVDAL